MLLLLWRTGSAWSCVLTPACPSSPPPQQVNQVPNIWSHREMMLMEASAHKTHACIFAGGGVFKAFSTVCTAHSVCCKETERAAIWIPRSHTCSVAVRPGDVVVFQTVAIMASSAYWRRKLCDITQTCSYWNVISHTLNNITLCCLVVCVNDADATFSWTAQTVHLSPPGRTHYQVSPFKLLYLTRFYRSGLWFIKMPLLL